MADWNPELYNRFRHYRAEPVLEIFRRLALGDRERVVDLGCGSGENTVEIARRSEQGNVLGLDSSRAMIDAANKLRDSLDPALRPRIEFILGDIRDFRGRANGEFSVIFSNAAFQWIPGHREIFRTCRDALAPGGRIVVQMPANDEETAKVELNKLAAEPRWSEMLGGIDASFRAVPPPGHYRRLLAELGYTGVDCYYRTFEHPMNNPGEIVEFYRSTGLRPFLGALGPERHDEFLAALGARYERAYGTTGKVTFPFRRLFIWARRAPG